MLTLRAPKGAPRQPRTRAERARVLAVSVALHSLVVLGLWQVLQFPRALGLFDSGNPTVPVLERIRFVTVAPPAAGGPVGSTARPSRPAQAPAPPQGVQTVVPPRPPAIAPTVAPPVVPEGVSSPRPGVRGATTGPLVGGQGAVRGVQPGYTEPILWVEPTVVERAPLEGAAKLDSAVRAQVSAYYDSLAKVPGPNKYERGDWTYSTKDGKKYGIDPAFIRLGKFSIPTALLGLLPLNQGQVNPIAYDRDKRLAAMRQDIMEHAQGAMNEEEFRKTVRAIRDRKERERKEQEKKKTDAPKIISERE